MTLPGASTAALDGLGLLDAPQILLLLGKRRRQLRVSLMPLPALGRQFSLCGDKYGLPEPLDAQLANQSQAGGGEEHFLAHGGRVRDIGHRHVAIGGLAVEFEEDVGGGGGGEEGLEVVEV